MGRKKKEIKGLGDLIEKITESTGIKTLVEKTTQALGIEDCGCTRRQEYLNTLVPFQTKQESQDESCFKEGKYLVQNNFVFTYNKQSFSYNKGDKIYIKENDPTFDTLKQFYKLNILKEDES
jgi:hypothetical protein